MHLLHPLRDADIFEEIGFINDQDGFFQVNYAFFEHAQLLEAHGHVVVCDIGKVAISLAVF